MNGKAEMRVHLCFWFDALNTGGMCDDVLVTPPVLCVREADLPAQEFVDERGSVCGIAVFFKPKREEHDRVSVGGYRQCDIVVVGVLERSFCRTDGCDPVHVRCA